MVEGTLADNGYCSSTSLISKTAFSLWSLRDCRNEDLLTIPLKFSCSFAKGCGASAVILLIITASPIKPICDNPPFLLVETLNPAMKEATLLFWTAP